MQVSTKKPQRHPAASTQSPSEKKFNDAWQRVAGQQKKNDRLRADAQAFADQIRARIHDTEIANLDAMYFTCLHLLSFSGRKSLTQWQREILLDWVAEYIRDMASHPFAQHLDMAALRERMAKAWALAFPEPQFPLSEDDNHAFDNDEDPYTEDLFQDLFAEFAQADAAGGPHQQPDGPDPEQGFFGNFFEQQQAHEQQRQDKSLALKQLIKSSSVNKLFRKVAGILHPDKERDETIRKEKNRLMGELIQARNTNDIPKIFAFYAEYVGESPLQELGGDLDSATELLNQQYRSLRDQKEDILDENPINAALYRRFHKGTPAAQQRAINKYLNDIRAHTRALSNLRTDITSVAKLKAYLEVRRDIMLEEDIFDFL